MAQANKFWIVEYVDVNAPKAERSEICLDKSDARHRAFKRGGIVHFVELENFVGGGLCDFLQNSHTFDNELH
jgi:hypothetical protein